MKITFKLKALLSSFIFTFLLLISSAASAEVPINIFENTNLYAKFLDHSKIESIITDNLELSENLHYKVNVKVIYEKSGKPDYLIVYTLSNETYSYETTRIDIDSDYNVDSIKEKYRETKADYSQGTVDIYASCPNDSIEMVFATCETGIPTAVDGVNAIAQTARNAGYNVQTLLGSSESRSAILNWLACDNLIFFGRIGHGSTSGIMVSDGTLSYTDFQNMSSNALNDKVLYFNSCQVHNSPLQPAVVNAGVQKYIGGIDNLYIGSSEEVFKCVAEETIAQHEALTSSLASCEASEYPYTGAHGISGNGSDYVGDGGSSEDCSAPVINVNGTSSSSISVSWNNAGANSYNVYYLKSGGSSWTLAKSGLTSTYYTVTGLTANTTYNVAVLSVCQDGSQPYNTVNATTDGGDSGGLTLSDVYGQYVRQPAANNWHIGTISADGSTLQWKNEAGASWPLIPDLDAGKLYTDEECPYFNSNGGDAFTLVLNQNSDGSVDVEGFMFLGELYSR